MTTLRGDVARVHADPQAIGAARFARNTIIQLPDLDATGIVPHNPLSIRIAIPITALRQSHAGGVAKLARAVLAVADPILAQPTPAVVG